MFKNGLQWSLYLLFLVYEIVVVFPFIEKGNNFYSWKYLYLDRKINSFC